MGERVATSELESPIGRIRLAGETGELSSKTIARIEGSRNLEIFREILESCTDEG